MSISLKKMATIVFPNDTIDSVVCRMAEESRKVNHPGVAIILDKKGILLGILTDGDLRRAYAERVSFSEPVSKVMTTNPVTISATVAEDRIATELIKEVKLKGGHNSESVRHVLLVDDEGKLVKVIDFLEALQGQFESVKKVVLFGMGYVGLTLAVSLANRGYQVLGIDIDCKLIKQLNDGLPHVHEPGLADMLRLNLKQNKINFSESIEEEKFQVYIVAVGTPLDLEGKPSLNALNEVLRTISRALKKGDQVMLRSTVPVGTTREIVVPFLEDNSGLKAGKDFFVTFAPERTIEGNAMYELKSLPQVLGGFSGECMKHSAEFWSTLTSSIVRMTSLEASELVKLANNTFRDISFAFSNELALLADRYNVDAFDLIQGANEGYSRNPIPHPSPGVGGYCLTKDPVLFSSTSKGVRNDAVLGLSSRKINEKAALYPYVQLKRFSERLSLSLSEMTVMIIGVAFKGEPETADLRGSVAVDLLHVLEKKVKLVMAWDAVVDNDVLKSVGFNITGNLEESIGYCDAVLILNNHHKNIHSELLMESKKGRLIFDGWKQLDVDEIEKIDGLYYSTMGYLTK